MAILILAAVAALSVFGYALYASVSLEAKKSAYSRRLLLFLLITGAGLCVGTLSLFFLFSPASKGGTEEMRVARDSFLMFLGTDLAFLAVGSLTALFAVLLKSKMRGLVNAVMPLWALVSLFWAYFCGVWSVFSAVNVTIYIYAFAAGGVGLLALPAFLEAGRRYSILSDKERRLSLIRAKNEKKQKRALAAEKRRSLRQKKKRLRGTKSK